MSVVYRAIWQADRPSDVPAALDQFESAVRDWAVDPAKPERSVTATARNDGIQGIDIECLDPPNASGALWKTTIRTAISDDCQHFMVSNEVESDDVTLRFSIGRPRVVADLLADPGKHWLGNSAIVNSAIEISASAVAALVEQLRSDTRTLPYIVFSEPSDFAHYDWRVMANMTAQRAAGIANVVILNDDAVTAFKNEVGELAVWGGGVRTYVPAPIDSSAPFRHRFIPARHIVHANPGRIVDRLVYAVAQLSTRRRVPDIFASQVGAEPELDLTGELEMQLQRVEHLEHELALEREDSEQAERELARGQGHLTRLREWFYDQGKLDIYYGAIYPTSEAEMPDEVEAISEAFLAAQAYLSDELSIPEAAGVDHDVLDTAPSAAAWGNSTWRGLRALAAYARDKRAGAVGDFWTWCEKGRPEGWPATKKKLAMGESETIDNKKANSKYKLARTFRVDPRLDVSGYKYMESHLKIAEGGGNLAPRIYFFDDTGGVTGKVHIGFVGPHYRIPNTKS